MASSVEAEVVRLRDEEHLSWPVIASRVGLGGKDAARRAYLRAAGSRPATRTPGAHRSLVQFVRDKRREGCPVCSLGADVRHQLAEAGSRKIPRAVQLEWLAKEVGAKVTADELSQHVNGRHDVEAAA